MIGGDPVADKHTCVARELYRIAIEQLNSEEQVTERPAGGLPEKRSIPLQPG
jgi:hypothetical protein